MATKINIHSDKLLSLAEAAHKFPLVDGRRPSTNSLWRWCRKGIGGIKLSYVRLGRRICTSSEALNQFASALAAADQNDYADDQQTPVRPRSTSARQKEIAAAEKECQAAGI